jgi:hypothetical protein
MGTNNNFQSLAGQQGRDFEEACFKALEFAGWEISDRRVSFPTVEIDIIATNREQISFYITCKGSIRGPRPGFRRTDTIKKAIAEAYFIHHEGYSPVLVMASPLPTAEGGRATAMIRALTRDFIYPYSDGQRLKWMCNASEDELRLDMEKNPSIWNMLRQRNI